jgi:ABC-type branched-subunit amino acid transport system substrate-binding protein
MTQRLFLAAASATLALTLATSPVHSQKKYDPGASDTEIKIGQTMPYSGPASAYGTIGRTHAAYFKKINEEGGINGRKITFVSLDDGYAPPKTVEMVRRLVEQDDVLLLFGMLGTPTNSAVHKYLNAKGIPQLLINAGASKFSDPKNFPWTLAYPATYSVEAQVYAKHIIATKPGAKIAVLYQNDDAGKDYLAGLKEGLGARSRQIVAEASYEISDPTVDSQIVALKASGADVLVNASTPKFAAMAIRRVYDIDWKPVHYVVAIGSYIHSVLVPAGIEKSIGVITATSGKDPVDPQWNNDPGMIAYRAFMKRYYPDGDPNEILNAGAYNGAMLLVQVLRECGDDLTRENVMRHATHVKEMGLPLSVPGVVVSTSPDDYRLIKTLQMRRFDGQRYVPISDLIRIGGQP